MWAAIIGVVGDAAMAVTVSLTIHFLRPAPPGDVLLYADGQADPVAHATVTYALPP